MLLTTDYYNLNFQPTVLIELIDVQYYVTSVVQSRSKSIADTSELHSSIEASVNPEKALLENSFDKLFDANGDLKRHTQSGKRFQCSECGKKFNWKGRFTQHLWTHMNGQPHACTYCEYTSKDKYDVIRHYRTHTCEKLYTCLLYTSPSPRDYAASRMPSSA